MIPLLIALGIGLLVGTYLLFLMAKLFFDRLAAMDYYLESVDRAFEAEAEANRCLSCSKKLPEGRNICATCMEAWEDYVPLEEKLNGR